MTITEVSKLYDITPDTLRYYERIGLIPKIHRKKMELETILKKIVIGWNLLNV